MHETMVLTYDDGGNKLRLCRPPRHAMELSSMIPYKGQVISQGHRVHGHLRTARMCMCMRNPAPVAVPDCINQLLQQDCGLCTCM